MKKVLYLLLLTSFSASAQVSIANLPRYGGNITGGIMPIVIGNATRSIDASLLMQGKVDSLKYRADSTTTAAALAVKVSLTKHTTDSAALKALIDANTVAIAGKQALLVNQTNIKSINNTSLVGSGNITISGALTNDTTSNAKNVVYGGDSTGRRGFLQTIKIFIDTTSLTDSSILIYSASGKYWKNIPYHAASGGSGGGGGTTPSGILEDLTYPTVAGGLTHTGTTWTGTTGSYGAFGLSAKVLGAGINGYLSETFTASDGTGIIAVRLDSVNEIWSANNYKVAAFVIGSGTIYYIEGGAAPVATAANCSAGDMVRIIRASSTWILQKSSDSGTTWGDGTTTNAAIHTYTYSSAAKMYVVCDVDGTNKLYAPKCFNCQ